MGLNSGFKGLKTPSSWCVEANTSQRVPDEFSVHSGWKTGYHCFTALL